MDDSFNESFFSKLANIFNKYQNQREQSDEGIDISNKSVEEIIKDLSSPVENCVNTFRSSSPKRKKVIYDQKGWTSDRAKKEVEKGEKIKDKTSRAPNKRTSSVEKRNSKESSSVKESVKKKNYTSIGSQNKNSHKVKQLKKVNQKKPSSNGDFSTQSNSFQKDENFTRENSSLKTLRPVILLVNRKSKDTQAPQSDEYWSDTSKQPSYVNFWDEFTFRTRRRARSKSDIIYEGGFDQVFELYCDNSDYELVEDYV